MKWHLDLQTNNCFFFQVFFLNFFVHQLINKWNSIQINFQNTSRSSFIFKSNWTRISKVYFTHYLYIQYFPHKQWTYYATFGTRYCFQEILIDFERHKFQETKGSKGSLNKTWKITPNQKLKTLQFKQRNEKKPAKNKQILK